MHLETSRFEQLNSCLCTLDSSSDRPAGAMFIKMGKTKTTPTCNILLGLRKKATNESMPYQLLPITRLTAVIEHNCFYSPPNIHCLPFVSRENKYFLS